MAGKTIEMTEEQLAAATRAAAEGGAKVALETMRGQLGIQTQLQTQEERVSAELGKPIPDRTPVKEWLVPCFNEDNGARFMARVAKSRTYPSGRVVDLVDYKYPDDIETRVTGMPVKDTKTGQYTVQFRQWRYETYDQADRRQYVGKAASRLPKIGDPILVEHNKPGRDESETAVA